MIIKNGRVFINGAFCNVDVKVADGKIVEVGTNLTDEEVFDASGKLVFAGFIDSHIHGALKHNLGDSVENVKDVCAYLPQFGVTSFIPTPTEPVEGPEPTALKVRNIRLAKGCKGADIAGIFLYTAYKNRSISYYAPPVPVTKEHTLALADGDLSDIRMVLIAPELPGAIEHIDWLVENGVIPLIGFSEGTPEDISRGVAHGATLTDHFPNGFPSIDHHLSMSTTQCLLEDDLYMQLNCDCIHVAKEFMRMMIRVKGLDHFLAVSDSSSLMGCPEGEYQMGAKTVYLRNGAVRDVNGKLVTGAHTFDENMRTLLANGFTLEEIGTICSENAAKALHFTDRGKIEAGRRADITIMDEGLNVERTMVLGQWVYVK